MGNGSGALALFEQTNHLLRPIFIPQVTFYEIAYFSWKFSILLRIQDWMECVFTQGPRKFH